ncbi:MAG TPA: CHAT domain-containing protein, partial [Blastocatellia bacterium]|nr:CHAT domain-containing protein [Blastocatellia bacterium]
DRTGVARTLISIGAVHRAQGNYVPALEQYQRGLKISEEVGDKSTVATALHNIGSVHWPLGNYAEAMENYRKSLKLKEELGDRPGIAATLNNIGIIHQLQSDYAQALEYYRRSLKISEELGSRPNLSMILNNIGNLYRNQENYAQALEYYRKSLKIKEELGDRLGIAFTLTNLGNLYNAQDQYPEALEQHQKSLKISEEMGDRPGLSRTLSSIGNVYISQGRYAEALEPYQRSLKIAEEAGDKAGVALIMQSLAFLYYGQGDYLRASEHCERSTELATQTGRRDILVQSQALAGPAYFALKQFDRARRSLAESIALIEALSTQVAGGGPARQRFFESKVSPYQAMVDLETAEKRFPEAFAYAQRLKGRILLDLLQNGRVNIDKSASPAEREQEQQLSRRLVLLNRQLSGERAKSQPDPARLTGLEEDQRKARLEFEAFQTTLYTSHPELKVQRGEMRPISLDDAAALIPNRRTAILDFVVTDAQVHLFVLTRDGSAPVTLKTYAVEIQSKVLAEKVERFRRRLANKDFDYQGLARELYTLLLKPAEPQLRNKTSLIISPDRSLWDLPFQVLQPREGHYLIEDAAISYVPSLSVLRETRLARRKRAARAGARLLALGNPELGRESIERAKFSLMGEALDPLPEAAAQVEALGRLYGPKRGQVYTGASASESVVKELASQYRILHLATHGILNDINPMYSHLMLATTSGKSEEDGLLEAWEIMNLDLNADLVVLSACETARGRVGVGEGVIGLTWALFVAGCPTTVVSQWKVESTSTTALMVEFHQGFKTRFDTPKSALSTAEAMRQASLKLMRNPQYRHPFFWGGFVVVGDGN